MAPHFLFIIARSPTEILLSGAPLCRARCGWAGIGFRSHQVCFDPIQGTRRRQSF